MCCRGINLGWTSVERGVFVPVFKGQDFGGLGSPVQPLFPCRCPALWRLWLGGEGDLVL